eukprot:CAMPEP_0206387732 /NCGR_PEP_ID=MMETSP0294-20121207/16811_1 /ASSEMBLY_ACC=CAM_ASM_000327 /TAXON_ID=39354 /ORGANISM="Heterosigma akashiwo, Strain CCMP2393" /LENGTH=435 /DNA_ID=CAMNT_0053839221 /DNA_START=176 /DNA_END=1483 /DNA_ORIENTATION=+
MSNPGSILSTSNHVTRRMGPQQSRAIDCQMRVEHEMSRKTIRLIILGIGHAGKSTVMKQLKLLFGVAPTLQERKFMADIIVRQVVRDLQLLIRKAEEFSMQETPFADEALKDMIRDMDPFCRLTPEIWEALRYIWSEVSIQFTWQNRSTFHVNDSLSYFMNNIDRLSQASYIPSQMDLVHAKVSTLGIAQQTFTFNHTDFRITDVGGQRSERRKWVHLFSDVNAILYIAALNDFDRFLEEDARQNALAESMAVFHEMYDSPHLHNVTFFLFLNKIDLFMEKLPRVPVNRPPRSSFLEGFACSAQTMADPDWQSVLDNAEMCEDCGSTSCDWLWLGKTVERLTREYVQADVDRKFASIDPRDIAEYNRAVRKRAYRIFIFQKYGFLGPGVRIDPCDCVCTAIRALWPDPRGEYVGFHKWAAGLGEKDPDASQIIDI